MPLRHESSIETKETGNAGQTVDGGEVRGRSTCCHNQVSQYMQMNLPDGLKERYFGVRVKKNNIVNQSI